MFHSCPYILYVMHYTGEAMGSRLLIGNVYLSHRSIESTYTLTHWLIPRQGDRKLPQRKYLTWRPAGVFLKSHFHTRGQSRNAGYAPTHKQWVFMGKVRDLDREISQEVRDTQSKTLLTSSVHDRKQCACKLCLANISNRTDCLTLSFTTKPIALYTSLM